MYAHDAIAVIMISIFYVVKSHFNENNLLLNSYSEVEIEEAT